MSSRVSRTAQDYGIVSAEALCVTNSSAAPMDLTLKPGDRIGLLGAVGSGKQQLLRILARLQKPSDGKILWSGVDVTHRPRWLLGQHQNNVILIWANPYALFADNASPRQVLEKLATKNRPSAGGPLHKVGFPAALQDIRIDTLSGYQRVRLALDYADRKGVRAILLDDIFSTLSPGTWQSLSTEVDQVVGKQRALLIASQYPQALTCTDQILVILDGEIVERGRTLEVLQNPQHAYTKWLTSFTAFRPHHVQEWQAANRHLS